MYGPYEAWKALSPAQPDWYMGWLEGALRIGPPYAMHLFGHTIPPPFWPAVLMPSAVFLFVFAWPWIELLFTGDDRPHNLLDRARDAPVRTAIGVGLLTFLIVLTFAGADDVEARYGYFSVYALVTLYRVLVIVLPIVAAVVAYFLARKFSQGAVEERAERVHVYRDRAGGFEEEAIP
jgi:ubiquinol-cytochrome c reductase cytochrome b subunit